MDIILKYFGSEGLLLLRNSLEVFLISMLNSIFAILGKCIKTEGFLERLCVIRLPWWLQAVKRLAYNVGDPGSVPGPRRSSGGGNGNPLQYSCLENPVDGGAWWATVHGVTKSRTRLSD